MTVVRRVLLVACAVVLSVTLAGCMPHAAHHYGTSTMRENTVHNKMDMLSVILHSRGVRLHRHH